MGEKKQEKRVMAEEVELTQKRLEHKITKRAETDKFKAEIKAAADKTCIVLKNEAEARRIELSGAAQAEATKLIAEAEARVKKLNALAYEQYGEAALVGEVLKTLPKMAAEISKPAMGVKKFQIVASGDKEIGFRRVAGEVMRIMDDVPEGVHNITGIDLKGEIKKVMNR